MQIRALYTTLALTLFFVAAAQSIGDFNSDRLDLNKKRMIVLGSWALANIASSPILASKASGSTKYFHQMNGYWNGVNLILAGVGYYAATTTDPTEFDLAETFKEQHSIEKILLFNAGLDIAYMVGGLYLRERSKNAVRNSDRLKGFGNALILQGAFLFAFDVGFFLVHNNHAKEIYNYVDKLSIGPSGFQLVWYL